MGEIILLAVIIFIVSAVAKMKNKILRMWHRKRFCESNRALCRALINAGFPDFKEYLFFKEDAPQGYENWYKYGRIEFGRSEMSKQDREKIFKIVEKYRPCIFNVDKDLNITSIELQG